jgi:hypothetical protein
MGFYWPLANKYTKPETKYSVAGKPQSLWWIEK